MARKSSKKIRKPAPRAKRAAKTKSLVAASESVRRERGGSAAQVTKRAVKTKPLTAASALVRHERDRKQPNAKVAVMAPLLAPGFSMMDTMKRFSMTNVEHIARLAACRTPMEFWFERMRFGQSLFTQWQSSVRSVLPGFGTR